MSHETKMYAGALLAPFQRIYESPAPAKLLAVVVALPKLLVEIDLFIPVWFLLLVVTLLDYGVGSQRAKAERRFDKDVSRARLLGKAVGLAVMWIVYVGELLAIRVAVDTHSMIASSLTALLIIEETRSLNRHKTELTGSPVPMLGPLLDWFESLVSRRVPQLAPEKALEQRRIADLPETTQTRIRAILREELEGLEK